MMPAVRFPKREKASQNEHISETKKIGENATKRIDDVWEREARVMVEVKVTEGFMKLGFASDKVRNVSIETIDATTRPAFGIHILNQNVRRQNGIDAKDRVFSAHVQDVIKVSRFRSGFTEGERTFIVLNDTKQTITWAKSENMKAAKSFPYSAIEKSEVHKGRSFWYFTIQFKSHHTVPGFNHPTIWAFKSIRKWLAFDADHGRTVAVQWVAAIQMRSLKIQTEFLSEPFNAKHLKIALVKHWLTGVVLRKRARRKLYRRQKYSGIVSKCQKMLDYIVCYVVTPTCNISLGVGRDLLQLYLSMLKRHLVQRDRLFVGNLVEKSAHLEERVSATSSGPGLTEELIESESTESIRKSMWLVFSKVVGLQELKWAYFWKEVFSEVVGAALLLLCSDLFLPGVLVQHGALGIAVHIFGHALLHLLLLWTIGSIGGGHFNPFITIATVFSGHTPVMRGVFYVAAQAFGTAVSQGLVPTPHSGAHLSNIAMECILGSSGSKAVLECMEDLVHSSALTITDQRMRLLGQSQPFTSAMDFQQKVNAVVGASEERECPVGVQAGGLSGQTAVWVSACLYLCCIFFLVLRPKPSLTSTLVVSVTRATLLTFCAIVNFASDLARGESRWLSTSYIDPFIHCTWRGGWAESDDVIDEKVQYLGVMAAIAALFGITFLWVTPRQWP